MSARTSLYEELLAREYGALQLREVVGTNLLRGTFIASSLLWILIGAGFSITNYILTHQPIPLDPPKRPYVTVINIDPWHILIPPPKAVVELRLRELPKISKFVALPDRVLPDTFQVGIVGGTGTGKDTGTGGAVSGGTEQGTLVIELPPEDTLPDYGTFQPVEQLPVLRLKVQPVYPEVLRTSSIRGSVFISFLVDKHGNVIKTKIEKADPPNMGFEQAAVDAVMQWKFTPAINNGQPVATWVTQPIKFTLK